MRKSRVEIGSSTVTKTASPDLMRIEVEKTRRAFEIANRTGLFVVPEVLDYDEKTGVAVFERLKIGPVSTMVPWGRQRMRLAEQLGIALAAIHMEMTLPDEMRIPLPPEFRLSRDEVFLHGDLSIGNVCVGNPWPPVVIIDWQMTPLYGGRSTYGTRYFDIFWFIANLVFNPSSRFIFDDPVAPVVSKLLSSYFRETGLVFEPEMVECYATRFFGVETSRLIREVFRGSINRRLVLFPFSLSIKNRVVRSLRAPWQEKHQNERSKESEGVGTELRSDYRRSHLDPNHARSYHLEFQNDPHRRLVWKLEKQSIEKILRTYFEKTEIHHLDFACGTGRILSHLAGRVRTSVGVDLSTAMVEVARKNNKTSEIIEADLTRRDVLKGRTFNLITAFRFFPNAQTSLRYEAMNILVKHLTKNGYLVFNNHLNTSSSTNRLARLLRRGGHKGMSMAEVQALVGKCHLEIIKIFHLHVFPSTGKHMLLPFPLLLPVEHFLSEIPILRDLGGNLIYVCQCTENFGLGRRQRDYIQCSSS